MVKDRRVEVGMTQAQLSDKTGIHVSYLSDLENARRDWTEEKWKAVHDVLWPEEGQVAA